MHPWPAPHVPQIPGLGKALRLYEAGRGGLLTTGGPGRATIALCGHTPSGGTHIGHAATYIAFDLVVRAWRDAGLAVTSVQHVPDADDEVLSRALGQGEDWKALVQDQLSTFALDMTALGILPADRVVDTADAVPEAVDVVQRLMTAGLAYRDDGPHGAGDIYATIRPNSHLERSSDGQRHSLDPLLWRGERPGEPAWDGGSLGPGRPSPDLVCAAEIAAHLRGRCDVLAAGAARRSHVETAAALLRVLTGDQSPVQRTVLTGTVTFAGMATSAEDARGSGAGGPVLVSELLERGASPLAIRLLVLAHHYRTDWEYSPAGLDEAEARLRRWTAAVSGNGGPPVDRMVAEVRAAVANDLDTPRALAAVDAWADESLAVGTPGGLSEGDLVEGAPGVAARAVDALLGVRL